MKKYKTERICKELRYSQRVLTLIISTNGIPNCYAYVSEVVTCYLILLPPTGER